MAYKDRTYVIFDGDKDMWAYAYMKGWKSNERIDFDFDDAHELKPLTYKASDEDYIKSRLRQRMKSAKQVIVLVGQSTKFLYKYVRWELELAKELDLPIIVVNLNGLREIDADLCPPTLKQKNAIHVSFNLKIIKYSLDYYPDFYKNRRDKNINRDYNWQPKVYQDLEL